MQDKSFYSESQTGHLSEWGAAIAQICEEKGIDQEIIIEVIESALSAAYKKETGRKGRIVRADFNEISGGGNFFEIYLVIDRKEREFLGEQDELEMPKADKTRKIKIWKKDNLEEKEGGEEEEEEKKPFFRPEREIVFEEAKKILPKIKVGEYLAIPVSAPKDFGRIAAQTAKQVILQKIKETEKNIIYGEYSEKVGEVLPGTVQRVEGFQVHVDLGKTIALLPRKEQVVGERYEQGQRLKVYVLRVDSESRNTMVIVSRTHPSLVEGLFKLEVPEIFAGIVKIHKVVREPGQRAKVAVWSEDPSVDSVGSCIGQRGTRVQAVTDELRGERIDLVGYNEDPMIFLERALSPAKIIKVEIVSEEDRRVRVFVDKDQQSIAIGRSGQNVRLASRLTGYEIDIELWAGNNETVETGFKPVSEEDGLKPVSEEVSPETVVEKSRDGVETRLPKTKKVSKKKKTEK